MTTLNLSEKAKQTEFADLVGTTQPAIAKLVNKGVLVKGESYKTWLLSYAHRLRTEAGGRGADNSARLTEARIAESHENTLSKRQDRLQKAGLLVVMSDIIHVIEEQGLSIQQKWLGAGDRIVQSIESTHKIEIDDELVYEPLRNSLRDLAVVTEELVNRLQGDDSELSS